MDNNFNDVLNFFYTLMFIFISVIVIGFCIVFACRKFGIELRTIILSLFMDEVKPAKEKDSNSWQWKKRYTVFVLFLIYITLAYSLVTLLIFLLFFSMFYLVWRFCANIYRNVYQSFSQIIKVGAINIVALAGIVLIINILMVKNYHGYCYSERRYIPDEEFIAVAIQKIREYEKRKGNNAYLDFAYPKFFRNYNVNDRPYSPYPRYWIYTVVHLATFDHGRLLNMEDHIMMALGVRKKIIYMDYEVESNSKVKNRNAAVVLDNCKNGKLWLDYKPMQFAP